MRFRHDRQTFGAKHTLPGPTHPKLGRVIFLFLAIDLLGAMQIWADVPGPLRRVRWASTGTARDHLRALARKRYVELAGHRGVLLCKERPALVRVPRVGRVVADVPVTSDENVEVNIAVRARPAVTG